MIFFFSKHISLTLSNLGSINIIQFLSSYVEEKMDIHSLRIDCNFKLFMPDYSAAEPLFTACHEID